MPKIEDLSADEIIDFLRNKDSKKAQTFISEGLFDSFQNNNIYVCCLKCGPAKLKKRNKILNKKIQLLVR